MGRHGPRRGQGAALAGGDRRPSPWSSRKPEPQSDPTILIQTLGRAGAVGYRGLVESFLTCAEDPMAARRALEVLCDDWNMTAEYAEVVRTFMEGVGWDDEGEYAGSR